MWLSSSGAKRLFRFCGVGGLVALVDFGLIRAFVLVLTPLAAVGVAYLIAVTLHFCLNRWWVFTATDVPAAGQLKRYVLVVGACWVCTLAVVALIVGVNSFAPSFVGSDIISFIPPVNGFAMLLRMTSVAPPPLWQVWLSIVIGVGSVFAALYLLPLLSVRGRDTLDSVFCQPN